MPANYVPPRSGGAPKREQRTPPPNSSPRIFCRAARRKNGRPARTSRRTFRIFGCGNIHKTAPKAARFCKRAALLPKSYPEKTAFSTDFYNIFTKREKFMTSLSTLCKTLWITSAAAAPFKTPLSLLPPPLPQRPLPFRNGRRLFRNDRRPFRNAPSNAAKTRAQGLTFPPKAPRRGRCRGGRRSS